MASEGHLIEGDGPPKVDDFKTDCNDSPWANLPAPVFTKLCSKLDDDFIRTARQICPQWLNNIETHVGLKVKIDDSIEGNLEFVQSVKVVQARIVNWRVNLELDPTNCNDNSLLFQFPTCLVKLTISGKMPDQWKISHLQQFPNLVHFVVRGLAMYSNDFTGFPLPEPGPEMSSEERHMSYHRYEPPLLPLPILLKRLKKLEIIMNEFSYPSVLPLSVRLNEPDRAMEHELYLQRLYFIVLNNITFLLNNVRSSQLSTVQFYIYPKAGIVPPSKLNWKNLPLQRFLRNHQNSLKQLFLPEYEGKHENVDSEDLEEFPIKLRKLQISLTKFIGDREEGREQNTSFWKRFLMEQTQLEAIYFQFSDLSTIWIEETLTSLSFSSKDTLHYVDIAVQSEETVQINLEMFSFCHGLHVLKIVGRDNETVLKNINKLPSSLVKLYISMSLVEPPTDPNFMRKFKNLEMVIVKTILVADHQQTPNRTLLMIRNLFSLRKLNLLMLTFDAPLNSNRDLVSVLSKVDEDMESPYPVFTIKFNLAYEFEEGWDEETFDEETLQIEYINMREPEEYSMWHNRHRNAISVDDEDHRIFIFQTLPFLLDLRGRRAGVNPDDEDIATEDDDDTDSDDSTIVVIDDRSAEI